jgi:hypothetical protein
LNRSAKVLAAVFWTGVNAIGYAMKAVGRRARERKGPEKAQHSEEAVDWAIRAMREVWKGASRAANGRSFWLVFR